MNTQKRFLKKIISVRTFIYIIGIIILAFGITLNTKTQLGVSPIISIPYNISTICKIPLGVTTFLCYTVMVFLQWILLGKKFKPHQFLQILMSLITSAFIQLFDTLIPIANDLTLRYLLLLAAIIFTGIGAALTVGMKIIPNPADGLASVIGMKLGKDFGFGKNVFDLSSIFISLCLGLLFAGQILGIGIGTICAMIFTGRVIALMQKPTNLLFTKVSLN
ncbi:MAG: DUF6198 family protein [Lachnospiraceae bacterium]|nr:DUF6198 family protein [Lachnospiraceae bacterium]